MTLLKQRPITEVHAKPCMDSRVLIGRAHHTGQFLGWLRENGVPIEQNAQVFVGHDAGNTPRKGANGQQLHINLSHALEGEESPTCGGALVTHHAKAIFEKFQSATGKDAGWMQDYFKKKGLDWNAAFFDVKGSAHDRAADHATKMGAKNYVSGIVDMRSGKVRVTHSSYKKLVGKEYDMPDQKLDGELLKGQNPKELQLYVYDDHLAAGLLEKQPGKAFAVSVSQEALAEKRMDPRVYPSIMYFMYNAMSKGAQPNDLRIRISGPQKGKLQDFARNDEFLQAIKAAGVRVE